MPPHHQRNRGNVKSRTLGLLAATAAISALFVTASPAHAVDLFTLSDNIRSTSGVWQGWQPPTQPPGNNNTSSHAILDVADNSNGSIHVDVTTTSGLWDNVRYSNGSWQGWEAPPQPPTDSYQLAGAGLPDGAIEYFAVGEATGDVYASTRNPNGVWTSWVQQPITVPGGELGGFTATADGNGNVQVMATAVGGAVYHTMQNSAGDWQSWQQPTQVPSGAFAVTSAGLVNGSVQFMAIGLNNIIYLDIRYANGTWQGWQETQQPPAGWVTSASPATFRLSTFSAAAEPDGDTQFLIVTNGDIVGPNESGFYHIVRNADGTWQKGWGVIAPPYGLCVASMTIATYASPVGGASEVDADCWTDEN